MLENFGFGDEISTMKRSIEMLPLKLADGGRILRFSEASSGLCLEKRLEPDKSVTRQKKRWERVFASMLEGELGVGA
jgi:hypothetical protein